MKVFVANRQMIRELNLPIPYLVISVKDPHAKFVEMARDPNRIAALRLECYDLCSPLKGWQGFTDSHAREIWRVVDKVLPDIDAIVCQCEAGISRSSAIAAALEKHLNGEGSERYYFETFLPNTMVYAIMDTIKQGHRKLVKDKDKG